MAVGHSLSLILVFFSALISDGLLKDVMMPEKSSNKSNEKNCNTIKDKYVSLYRCYDYFR